MSAVPYGRPEQFPVCPICGKDVQFEDCTDCDGDGWTVEAVHSPECFARGECIGGEGCPVPEQVECNSCGGTGAFPWCPEHGVVHNYVFRKLIVLDGGKL